MENFETPIVEKKNAKDFLTEHNLKQRDLAKKLFEEVTGIKIDPENRDQKNDAMEYWVEKGYSKAFRDLENSEEFKNHPQLQGDIGLITLEHVRIFMKTGRLSEE